MAHHPSLNSSMSSLEDQFDILRMNNNDADDEIGVGEEAKDDTSSTARRNHNHNRIPNTGRPLPQQQPMTATTTTTTTRTTNTNTTSAVTPGGMKTPTMETLTRKYEFLLGNDNNNNNTGNSGDNAVGTNVAADNNDQLNESNDDDAYFRTPPPASSNTNTTTSMADPKVSLASLERTLSRNNSRNNSRQSSRNNSPVRTPVRGATSTPLSAQSILDRLGTPEATKLQFAGGSRAASPSWDNNINNSNNDHGSVGSSTTNTSGGGRRYRSQLKQNLEERLQQLEDPNRITSPHLRPYPQQQGTPSRSTSVEPSPARRFRTGLTPPRASTSTITTTKRQSPFHKAFSNIKHSDNKKVPMNTAATVTANAKSNSNTNKSPTATTPKATTTVEITSDTTRSLPSSSLAYDYLLPDAEVRENDDPARRRSNSNLSLGTPSLASAPPAITTSATTNRHNSATRGRNVSPLPPSFPVSVTKKQQQSQQQQQSQIPSGTKIANTPPATDISQKNNDQQHSTPKTSQKPQQQSTPQSQQQQLSTPQSQQQQQQQGQHYEEDTASFWHRWKLAERRMQQQQDQFEEEKHDWVRQLDSAYQANAQVEALAKRMEVQLLAVHKTCLQQDNNDYGDDDDDDDNNGSDDLRSLDDNQHQAKEVPLDPLHLLMLKESGVADDADLKVMEQSSLEGNNNDNNNKDFESAAADSFEYTERLERRMSRTRTKNIIMSHLVKLLERQSQEQTSDLKQQLQVEKEQRQVLWEEIRQLERRLEQQPPIGSSTGNKEALLTTPQKGAAVASMRSPPPTESDQYKALQHRLWMREQQYEHERKDYETKLEALQVQCDRQKLLQLEVATKTTTLGDESNVQTIQDLQFQLETTAAEKQELNSKSEAMQTQFEQIQQHVRDVERAHMHDISQHKEEHARTEQQLATALEDVEDLSEQAKAMNSKMARLETKFGREKKQWEWSLKQQGKRAEAVSNHNTSTSVDRLQKLHELERCRWERQLQTAQSDMALLQQTVDDSQHQLVEALAERKELESQLASLQQKAVDDSQRQQVEAQAERKKLESQLASLQQQIVDEKDLASFDAKVFTEQLESENKDMKEQLNLIGSECAKKSKQISDLQTWLEESNAEVARLQKPTKQEKQDPIADDLVDEQVVPQQPEKNMRTLELAMQAERENMMQAQIEHSRLRDVIQELKKTHQDEIRHLEDQLQALSVATQTVEQVATLDENVNQGLMAERYQGLDSQLQDVTSELEQCQLSLSEENAKCKDVMATNGELQLEMLLLDKRRDEEKTDLASLVEALQNEKITSSEAHTHIQSLLASKAELERSLQEVKLDLQATTQGLESEVSRCKEVISSKTLLEKELQELDVGYSVEKVDSEAKYMVLQEESSALQFSFKKTIADLQIKGQMLEAEVERLVAKSLAVEEKTDLPSLVDTIQNEKAIQSLSSENEELENSLREMNSDLQATEKALESEVARGKETTEAKILLEKQLQQLDIGYSRERGELETRYEVLQKDSSTVQLGLNATITDLETKGQMLEAEVDRLVSKSLGGKEKTDLPLGNEDLESTRIDLQATTKTLESEVLRCREVTDAKVSLEKQLQQLDVGYSIERRECGTRYEVLQNESSATQLGLKETIADLELKGRELESKVERLVCENQGAQDYISSTKLKLGAMQEGFQTQRSQMDNTESHEENANLMLAIQDLRQALEVKEADCRELVGERDALYSKLTEEKVSLESCVRELEGDRDLKEWSYQKLEATHSSLDRELQRLNQRFIEEMREMENRYQSLLSESSATRGDLEAKNADVEGTALDLQAELSNLKENNDGARLNSEMQELKSQNALLVARAAELQEELSTLNNNADATRLEPATLDELAEQTILVVQPRVELSGLSATGHERHYNASALEKLQIHNTALEARAAQLQTDLDSAFALAEQAKAKVEELTGILNREREEFESQKPVLTTCESTDSVRTLELIEEKADRERQLDEAKKELEVGLEALRTESEKYRTVVKNNSLLENENKQLRVEKEDWESHVQAMKADTTREIIAIAVEKADLLQKQEALLSEKLTLQSQLITAERQIEVAQILHETSKLELHEQYRLQSADSCTHAVEELKLEVNKMGEQLIVSNETIKDLTEKQSQGESILVGFDRIQQTMEGTATRIAEESRAMGSNQAVFVRRLAEMEELLEASFGNPGGVINIDEHKALLGRLRDTCLRFEEQELASAKAKEVAMREEYLDTLAGYKKDLTKAKSELLDETSKREAADTKFTELSSYMRKSNEQQKHPQSLVIFDECDSWDGDCDLDVQLAALGAQIQKEMDEIRKIGIDSEAYVETTELSEDILSARQAMTAQTLLLVQSIRDLVIHDGSSSNEDEEPPTSVLQHLEILSELMGEVDVLESKQGPPLQEKLLQLLQIQSGRAESAINIAAAPNNKAAESDLLRFELDQDETMLDLLHDTSRDQSLLCDDQEDVPDATTSANIGALSNTLVARSGAISPIDLVVEQTYSRCQVLERERCDLINVTLDLLSTAREASKAELDAALATARRKASEEMIAMKKDCQAEASQIWGLLCNKCRSCLTQGH